MKRMRMMGLCLVAAFALTVIGASTASALPEVGRCVAQAGTGKYKNANCTEKAGTKVEEKQFEFKKGAKSETEGVKFTSAGGEGILETANGTKIVCTTQSAVGKYDQDSGVIKEVENVTASFHGCGIPALEAKCNSTAAAEGDINTFALKGPLGYISGEKTKTPSVGQLLTPEKAKGLFAEFKCLGGSITVKVKGKEGAVEGRTGGNCIIAPVESPNVMTTTATQVYSGAGGKQVPQHFQLSTAKFCNLESNTNGGPFEGATQALTTVVTNEEALEIKA
jgi:hypothetical protein